jgi:chorismate mutase/prephenate dehydratase
MTDRRREVEDLRRQMTEADVEMLRALQRRAGLARQIGELGPAGGGGGAGAAANERDVLGMVEQTMGDELPLEVVRAFLRQVHAATSSLERPARVAFVAPEGGFCQVAAQKHFGLAATLVLAETTELALDEVRRQRADFAVFPFESTLEGPLRTSVEALSSTELSLTAKIELLPNLCLMSKSGNAADVEKLYAFASDQLASQKFIASLPRATLVDVRSPVAACQACKDDPQGAAIVARETGEELGLVAVQASVSDRPDLRIRYGLVSTRPTYRSGDDTTAVVFGVSDQPGALFDVLKHFAERGINLKSIQSRPMQALQALPVEGESWNYLFYAEISGHVTDRAVVTALEEVKRQTRLLKVLGSFPSC